MKKPNRFRPRPGYERLPGRGRFYKDLTTGETISKRQYVKRTEGVKSLEEKAKRNKLIRKKTGKREPMARYDAIVRQYKETHGKKIKVKGDSTEAKRFRKIYHDFTTTRSHGKTKAERFKHFKAGQALGIINKEYQFGIGRYTA